MLPFLLIPLGVVVLDQLVKLWAAASLKGLGTYPLIEGVFHLTYAENTGAAFSFFQGGRLLFLIITPLALGVLVWLMKKNYFATRLAKLAALLVLGGALGNFIDRVRVGYVVDMFDFCLIGFPIFNVADIALTVGVGLLILYVLTYKEAPREGDHHGDTSADHPTE